MSPFQFLLLTARIEGGYVANAGMIQLTLLPLNSAGRPREIG